MPEFGATPEREGRGVCSIDGCDRPVRKWRLCVTHYHRVRDHGNPRLDLPLRPLTPQGRFWAKVDKGPDCWLWTGCVVNRYGQFKTNGQQFQAHRWAWEELRGPIPDGLVLDHLCRRPLCVNPDHLEVVTQRENIRRGNSPIAAYMREVAA